MKPLDNRYEPALNPFRNQGFMSITCPDGRELQFGNVTTKGVEDGDGTTSGEGTRVSIRVFDWWFFVRVAMEYDLGLARCGTPWVHHVLKLEGWSMNGVLEMLWGDFEA